MWEWRVQAAEMDRSKRLQSVWAGQDAKARNRQVGKCRRRLGNRDSLEDMEDQVLSLGSELFRLENSSGPLQVI